MYKSPFTLTMIIFMTLFVTSCAKSHFETSSPSSPYSECASIEQKQLQLSALRAQNTPEWQIEKARKQLDWLYQKKNCDKIMTSK